MKFQNTAMLSLGSNLGDRLENLQWCIDHIHCNVATVVKVSGIYENPSVGFEGADFYNCCIVVHTHLPAGRLLAALQDAEHEGGRVRKPNERYHSRTIDIDIIAFNNEIINEPHLHIPHPRMQSRNFVLYPLRDVAPNWVHPVLKQGVGYLLEHSGDSSACTLVVQLPAPVATHSPQHYGYIAIEGNIGAGKTSLAGRIAEDFGGKVVLERFADNPFLPQFYKDPQRYAFSLEMSFLADRYQQLTEGIAETGNALVVADYHIIKSLIFAKVTLGRDEYTLYRKLFDIMYSDMRKPGLYIYLHRDTETLLQHIRQRGRSYEQDIKAEYLERINKGYLEYIENQAALNALVLDVSGRDFVNSQEDYLWVLEKISMAASAADNKT